ncbi:MAG: immunoglobulin domain-containing protein [Verrucomicrobia bacterium]|nr:immunoglobulin domain-containing protein [Verrucomicrobiota bacterium]
MSNAEGTTNSPPAILTVLVPAAITESPQSQTVLGGTSAEFNVRATGTAPLRYQWQRNGTNFVDGGRISGATTDTLTIGAVVRADAGGYSVIASNAAGVATSTTASLTVEPLKFVGLSVTADRRVHLNLQGEIGMLVKLQATTNFMQWSTLGSFPNTTGALHYEDVETNYVQRFYRAVMQ